MRAPCLTYVGREGVYLVRTNGLMSYELFDVTDPREPQLMSTIATTGVSGRAVSNRDDRETHKIQCECESGIGYFNALRKVGA